MSFHVLPMLFGFGIWAWRIPALVLLVCLAGRDNSRPGRCQVAG